MTPNVTIDLSGRNGDLARLRDPKEWDGGVADQGSGTPGFTSPWNLVSESRPKTSRAEVG